MIHKYFLMACLLLIGLMASGCRDSSVTNLTGIPVTSVSDSGQSVDLQHVDTVFMAVQKPLNVIPTGNNRYYVPTKGPEFQRELVREAFLIAARDEIGVLTRDELLGESRPGNDHTLSLRFHYVMPGEENDGGPLRQLSFRRLTPDGGETKFLDYDYTLWIRDHSGYMKILKDVERMSREDFAQSLKSAGMKKFVSPNATAINQVELGNSLKSIDLLLDNLSLVSQFDAVRQTHLLIRDSGESLPLLQRLVRGYAQLYLLSEHHFLKTRFVFQSRALLYAQRIVAKYGETRENLGLRGAVFAYITYFELARESFAQADSQNPAPDADVTLSQWVEIARACADYDFAAMETWMKEYDQNHLAKLAYYLMHEYTLDSKTAQKTGRELSEKFSCMRILDGMAGISSFDPIYAADGKEYTEYYDTSLSEELLNIKGLPDDVAETIQKKPSQSGGGLFSVFGQSRSNNNDTNDRFQRRKRILDALLAIPEDEDSCEMSWQALAHLIREESVIQIYHVAKGIRGHNSESAYYLQSALPVYQGHPLEKVLRCVVRNRDAVLPLKNEIASETPPYSFADITTYYLWIDTDRFGQTNLKTQLTPDEMAMAQIDWDCYRDLYYVWKITELNRGRLVPPSLDKSNLAAQLIRSAPHSPLSLVGKIDFHWQYNDDDVMQWSGDFNRFPSVLQRIVGWLPYHRHKSLRERKEQLLRFICENSETRKEVSGLADFLVQQGKPEEALTVLENYLGTSNAEDGLNRYVIAGEMARILMQEKRFDEALKYAGIAGSSYSASGLRVLAECREIMGDFKEAEKAFNASAKNYSNYKDETLRWAMFCRRVDSPEWEKAKASVMASLKNDQANNKTLTSYTEFFLAAGLPMEEGLPDMLHCYRQLKYDRLGWQLLMNAIADGDKNRANALFSLMLRECRFQDDVPNDHDIMFYSHSLTNLLWLDYHSEKPGNIDEDAIDYVLQLARDCDLISGGIQHVLCPLAMYYDALGNGEKAVYYARQSLASTEATGFAYRNIAVNLLKKHNPDFSPDDYAELMKNEKVKISPVRLFDGMSDLISRMVLQKYNTNAAEILLDEGTPDPIPAGMLPLFSVPYTYCKVKSLKFRDQTWNENEVALKCVFSDGCFMFRGIGCDLFFPAYAEKKPGEPTMIKLTDAYCNASFRGLIVWNDDNQPIRFCLNLREDGSYPKNMESAENSNCIVFELEKMDTDRPFRIE
jgi:predicted negative regulator of RcsB-dependent stress response